MARRARRRRAATRYARRRATRSSATRYVRRRSSAYNEPTSRAPRVPRVKAAGAVRRRSPRNTRVPEPQKVLKMQRALGKRSSRPSGAVLPASKRERAFRHFRAAAAGRAYVAPSHRRAYHRRRS